MEEWIGLHWHRFITRAADTGYTDHAVPLAAVAHSAGILFRAAGGHPAVRVVPAGLADTGGPRGWLQRVAGSGQRARLAQLDADTLALPPQLAVFGDASLNRDLYLWLAVLAAVQPQRAQPDWLADNVAATRQALQRCPGLRPRWQRLLAAHLAQRPHPQRLQGAAAAAEARVQAALRSLQAEHTTRAGGPAWSPTAPAPAHGAAAVLLADQAALQPLPDAGPVPLVAASVAPVWLWLEWWPPAAADGAPGSGAAPAAQRPPQDHPSTPDAQARSATRRRTRRAQPQGERAPLLLPSRSESILSWDQHVPMDRATDDEPDPHALAAAEDMTQLTLSRDSRATASKLRFDLDLPSAAADDQPLGPGVHHPEWDWKRQRLLPAHCCVQTFVATGAAPFEPGAALRATAQRVQRRLAVLQAAPRLQRGCADGEHIDLDAWVCHLASGAGGAAVAGEPAVYARAVRGQRSLATLLLADLSLSTDAHVNDTQRVIDVIRDALYVFGQALHASGDPFAILGFSSVRRQHVRLQHLLGFGQRWDAAAINRVGAIKPGYYTRMGAALREATAQLQRRPERQRLLLILTDGKPHDIDCYEGRWGIEDTRHAVQQARQAGLLPFCLSIDEQAHDYLPHLFGHQGWAQVRRPGELPTRLAAVYARMARYAR